MQGSGQSYSYLQRYTGIMGTWFLLKIIQHHFPWKGCLRTACTLPNFEWFWNADSKRKWVLKKFDFFPQVDVEDVLSWKLFQRNYLIPSFYPPPHPRQQWSLSAHFQRAHKLIWPDLNLYGLESLVFLNLESQAEKKKKPFKGWKFSYSTCPQIPPCTGRYCRRAQTPCACAYTWPRALLPETTACCLETFSVKLWDMYVCFPPSPLWQW